jgi:beta-lactamase regulating signal transducer with metallopeptidase domain
MDSLAMHLEPLLAWLLRTTWQAGILIGLVLLLQRVLGRRLGVRGRYCLWLLVLLRLALPGTLQSPVSVYNVLPSAPLRGYEASGAPTRGAWASVPTTGSPAVPTPEPPGSDVFVPLVEATAAQRGQWPRLPARVTILLSLVWLAGAASLAGCILASNLRLRRMVRRSRPVTDHGLQDLLDECRHLLGVRARPRVITTDEIGSPALLGLWRPYLLLPQETLAGMDPVELRHIFLHELAHLKRRDILISHIASGLHVLHWFNPLVTLGLRRMWADRELACDALALSVLAPGAAVAYGRTIIHQIEQWHTARPRWTLAALSGDKARIRERLAMIAQFRRGSYRWSWPALVLAGCLAGAGLTEGFTPAATWDGYARRDFPTTHQDRHANILRVSIRHTQTDRFLVARGDQVACDAREPGAAGLWEVRFEDGSGDDRDRIVYFYSVAMRKYLTWNRDGNGVALDGREPNEKARWAIWHMGGGGDRIVPYPFAHFYLRVLARRQVKTPYGTDPGMFWDISQVWRVKTSGAPKSKPKWCWLDVPGPD